MREEKYDTILNIAIVILIVSSLLLLYTGYKHFFKSSGSKETPAIAKVSVNPTSERDSLQVVYNNTSNEIDKELLTDSKFSTDTETKSKLSEMSSLREEITTLLKNQTPNNADLSLAKLKIEELQLKVALLQNRYTGVEAENKRLQFLLNQLVQSNKNKNTATDITVNKGQTVDKIKIPTDKFVINSITAVGLQLLAVTSTNSKDQETSESEEADKMIGSFSFKNANSKSNNEVMVVVIQPDGKVVKNSVWESGTFETKDGKKIYSRKISVEPSTEERRLNFSLSPDNFLKGDYIMQIWHNGNLIAKTIKTLS
jgi:hypothetical protein